MKLMGTRNTERMKLGLREKGILLRFGVKTNALTHNRCYLILGEM